MFPPSLDSLLKSTSFKTLLCFLPQFRCGTHWRLLSAVRCSAGAGSWKRDPRPTAAGEEDETAEKKHVAGKGEHCTQL